MPMSHQNISYGDCDGKSYKGKRNFLLHSFHRSVSRIWWPRICVWKKLIKKNIIPLINCNFEKYWAILSDVGREIFVEGVETKNRIKTRKRTKTSMKKKETLNHQKFFFYNLALVFLPKDMGFVSCRPSNIQRHHYLCIGLLNWFNRPLMTNNNISRYSCLVSGLWL